ncbi:MAG: SCO family protein [Magnetococcales bacterium]|nr:SCO family protein [Magnetococcales bacterium]
MERPTRWGKRKVQRGLLILLLLVVGVFAVHLIFHSTRVDPVSESDSGPVFSARPLSNIQLLDHHGQPFGAERFKGFWSMVFVGYTLCPDICPTSLGMMAEAFHQMEQGRSVSGKMNGIFVSVDPKRDTPEKLKEYVQYFHPSFIGVTGTQPQIDHFAQQVGAIYAIHDPEDPNAPETYEVIHSASIYFIDPQGRLVDVILEPRSPMELIEKMVQWQKGAGL